MPTPTPTPTPTPGGEKLDVPMKWCPLCSGDNQLKGSCSHSEIVTIACPEPGSIIASDYEYISLLGMGGMGVVYKCRNIHLDKVVAVKMLAARHYGSDDVIRFQKEARAAGKFNHPNLVSILDFGITDDGDPFMVMEYLQGSALADLIASGKINRNYLLSILIECCIGLAYAHEHGVFHRDLKPANIMVVGADGNSFVKILDFGIAKIADAGKFDQTLTGQGLVFGTPPYMSPEQSVGETLTDRCDVYSMGCVMYEAFTGRRPFELTNILKLVNAHRLEIPKLIGEVSPDKKFPENLEVLVSSMLLKEPASRPSMSEVAEDLRKILDEEERLAAIIEVKPEPQIIAKRREKLGWSVLAWIIIATVMSIPFTSLMHPRPSDQKTFPRYTEGVHDLLPETMEDPKFMRENSLRKTKQQLDAYIVSFNDTDLFPEHLKLLASGRKDRRQLRLVSCSKLTPANLKLLRPLSMKYLTIKGSDLTNDGLKVIADDFVSLEALDLDELENVNNIGYRYLSRLPHLTEITITGRNFDEETIKILSELKLRMISLNRNPTFNENGLDALRKTAITDLRLSDLNVTDRGAETISKIPNLQFLTAYNLKITDTGFAAIGQAPKLAGFSVAKNRGITDKSANTISEIYGHRTGHSGIGFVLDDTSITGAILPQLKQLKGLALIGLRGLKGFDSDVLSELKRALPKTILDTTGKHDVDRNERTVWN